MFKQFLISNILVIFGGVVGVTIFSKMSIDSFYNIIGFSVIITSIHAISNYKRSNKNINN